MKEFGFLFNIINFFEKDRTSISARDLVICALVAKGVKRQEVASIFELEDHVVLSVLRRSEVLIEKIKNGKNNVLKSFLKAITQIVPENHLMNSRAINKAVQKEKSPTKESLLINEVLVLLKSLGAFAWRNNNIPVYDCFSSAYRRFSGVKGVSDIIAVFPHGKVVFIEVKTVHQNQSIEQFEFQKEIENRGGNYVIVRSTQDLNDYLKENKII